MKKFRFFSFASAMLLASAAGMVSCSSDSIEPTGGSGATGQVVKTQFAINIPYGGNSSTNQAKKVTRMTDEMTQQSGKPFRGISDIVLLTSTVILQQLETQKLQESLKSVQTPMHTPMMNTASSIVTLRFL